MKSLGMLLLIVGCTTAVTGLVLLFANKLHWPGRLPGAIHYHGRNSSFQFPLTTCIVVSIILTVVLNLVLRWFKR